MTLRTNSSPVNAHSARQSDPAHDLLQATQTSALDVFFAPRSVAVIGATENPGSVGRTLITNLIASPFGGTVYPINPKRPSVLGIRAYPSVADVPEPVDLAVIVTPAPTVPGIIADCVQAGIKGAIVISAGFKETGAEGIELERRVLEAARSGGMRIIGPNCLGVMSPLTGLNATFAQAMARPGKVAFLSQSGALLTAVLDYAIREQIGFSAFASLGSMLDVGWGDLIDYLGNDPRTTSIVLYMESVGDARAFLSAAREVALTKPIIVIKAGRTSVGAKAAASHTGSLTGSDEVLDAAFARAGVLRVNTIADVFALTEALAKQPTPQGNRLTIVTNAGGPGVLATDALISGGGQLTPISDATMAELNGFLPAAWSHNNPIDVLGDAGADRYAKTLELAAKDENADGLLVILTPQAMTDATRTAEYLRPYARSLGKPVLASWMGGATIAAGEQILSDAGIPTFPYPDTAADVFNTLWRYTQNLRSLYETPTLAEAGPVDAPAATQLLREVRARDRVLLTEAESKQILTAYNIPTVETHIAADPDSAVAFAERMGYPSVLKLHSETVTHKTDVGGVQLNLPDADAVRAAFDRIGQGVTAADFLGVTVQPMVRLEGYEIILGASPDPQFGPVILFGTGGQLVEVYKDRALALPPLSSTLAQRLMERTKIFTALQGVRGRPPVDIAALEQVLVRFSQLVVEQPLIKEIDINPLLVSPDRMIALDARIVLYDREIPEEDLPRPAIRPYPTQYVGAASLRDGTAVDVRPIRPEDEPALVAFHQTLSERSVALRYYEPLALDQRVAHERLQRIAFTDYDREIALVAVAGARLIAVARLSRVRGGIAAVGSDQDARFTLLVSDEFQNQGLGTLLLARLVEIAKSEGLRRIHADVLAENLPMQSVCARLGFQIGPPHSTPSIVAVSREIV
ncbi:MAG: bifunctional acetate--CoA ligase family protein/GNAT family N-acetyltransferase [Cytophagales bacterium]|nr:bifunctional acetate--CoA ligase family protein/GNAT family N-acetyltransferase [Armatimonadota bacterium]